MGILDAKTRIFDTIITTEGKKQLANGKLKPEYYSFSDSGAIYTEDTIVSGGLSPSDRIVFEAGNLPQDFITLEADDSGKIASYRISGSVQFIIRHGDILTGSAGSRLPVSGAAFVSQAEQITETCLENFKKLYILQSPDPIDDKEKELRISSANFEFKITNDMPISNRSIKSISIDQIEGLFYDKRLSHIPNFNFLPPVNKKRIGEQKHSLLARYVNLRQNSILDYGDIESAIEFLEKKGFSGNVRFLETSKQNNLMCQFFEISDQTMTKLDVIDFGLFNSSEGTTKHVFFVGKVFTDQMNVHTFVNMFIVIFK